MIDDVGVNQAASRPGGHWRLAGVKEVAAPMAEGAHPLEFRAPPRLSVSVADTIRDLILTGSFRGGDYLRLDKIAGDLGVSATPVREALMELRSEGFVELQPRRGFVVSRIQRRDIEDLFMIQGSVSGELAARAAEAMTPAALDSLREIHGQFDAQSTELDTATATQLTHAFHREINLAANSPKLAWILGTVGRFPDRFFAGVVGWIPHSVDDHAQILAALEQRDEAAAREATTEHFGKIAGQLITHLDQHNLWTE
jgi:DNA-binding GntR family transcriptional regulator